MEGKACCESGCICFSFIVSIWKADEWFINLKKLLHVKQQILPFSPGILWNMIAELDYMQCF